MSHTDESPLTQLTVRGFGREVERAIRRLARAEGISLNEAVLRLLRRGAGIGPAEERRDVVGSSLDDLAGTWTEAELREFEGAGASMERIDDDFWGPRRKAVTRVRRR